MEKQEQEERKHIEALDRKIERLQEKVIKKHKEYSVLLRSFPHCWMNDTRNGKSRGQNRRCMMYTWKVSVHWMKSLT